ncbi:hypothetical protein D3C74_356700 [compost metagenome]
MEVRRDEVVRPGQGQDDERRQERDTEPGADRDVARAVEHVVLALVLGHRGLEERVDREEREQQARDHDRRDEDVERERVARDHVLGLPRHES